MVTLKYEGSRLSAIDDALKCDVVPYKEEKLKYDGLKCQNAMASPLNKKR